MDRGRWAWFGLLAFARLASGQAAPDMVWLRGGHDGDLRDVAVTRDGTKLVTSSPNAISLWNLTNGELSQCHAQAWSWNGEAAIAPDDSTYAYVRTQSFGDYRFESFLEVRPLVASERAQTVWAGRFGASTAGVVYTKSPEEVLVVWPYSGTVGHYDLASGLKIFSWSASQQTVAYKCSPTEAILAMAGQGKVRFWDYRDGSLAREWAPGNVQDLEFSESGQLLATVEGQLVVVRRVSDGSVISSWLHPNVASLTPDLDGKVASLGYDGSVQVRTLATGVLHESFVTEELGAGVLAPGNRLVTESWNTVKVWDTTTGFLLSKLGHHGSSVEAVAYSPDGEHVVSAGLGEIHRWSTLTGDHLGTDLIPPGRGFPVSLSISGQRVAYRFETTVEVYDTSEGTLAQTFTAPDGWNSGTCALSADGTLVTLLWGRQNGGGFETLLETRAIASGVLLRSSIVDSPLGRPQYSRDSRYLATTNYDLVQVFDATTLASLGLFPSSNITEFAFSYDSRKLIVNGSFFNGGTTTVFDIAGGQGQHFATNLAGALVSGPYGATFLQAGLGNAGGYSAFGELSLEFRRLVNGNTAVGYSTGLGAGIRSLALSPDGRTFAAGRGDGAVFVARVPSLSGLAPPPSVTGSGAFVTSTPEIAKNARGNFSVFVSTRHSVQTDNAQVTVTLRGLTDHNNNEIVLTQSRAVTRQTATNQYWEFDLETSGVPRFIRPQIVRAVASVVDNGVAGKGSQKSLRIRLPVLWVRGIRIWVVWNDPRFVSGMASYGYQPEGSAYPTFWPLEYDPNDQVLATNAQFVDTMVRTITREASPVTYAAKVDIVAHSKGGLVARQYLKDFADGKDRVRRLVMAASPHTGAVSAFYAQTLSTAVQIELLPTHPWWRSVPGTAFQEFVNNGALKALNQSLMPQEVEYHLLYGNGHVAYANLTDFPLWLETAPGDTTVLSWSQTGYETVNPIDGEAYEGELIRAFDAQQGARPPSSVLALPYGHSGFLGQAVDTVNSILARP